jgi:hypothetical protein
MYNLKENYYECQYYLSGLIFLFVFGGKGGRKKSEEDFIGILF